MLLMCVGWYHVTCGALWDSLGFSSLLKLLTASLCLLCVPVIKTRLQSLNRGSTEDTYSGVVDCIR